MKTKNKIVGSLLCAGLMFGSVFGLTGCSIGGEEYDELSLISEIKKDYYIGDELDLEGVKVELFDKENKLDILVVDVVSPMVSGFDTSNVGDKTLTITYHGFKCLVNYSVKGVQKYELTKAQYEKELENVTYPSKVKSEYDDRIPGKEFVQVFDDKIYKEVYFGNVLTYVYVTDNEKSIEYYMNSNKYEFYDAKYNENYVENFFNEGIALDYLDETSVIKKTVDEDTIEYEYGYNKSYDGGIGDNIKIVFVTDKEGKVICLDWYENGVLGTKTQTNEDGEDLVLPDFSGFTEV